MVSAERERLPFSIPTEMYTDIASYSRFFAERGAKVVVNDVSAEAAQKVVDEINKGKLTTTARLVQIADYRSWW